MGIFKPKLIDTDGDSWEELDATEIANGAASLRWLVWVYDQLLDDFFFALFTSFFFFCLLYCFKISFLISFSLQPKIDEDSLEILSTECPRIMINPKPSPFGFRGDPIPREALPDITLDDPVVKDIDPTTWAVCGFNPKTVTSSLSSLPEMSVAEKFRLAFVERDTRLAPKRAKNARQNQRRAEREWMMTDTRAKALALASQASKSLHSWN